MSTPKDEVYDDRHSNIEMTPEFGLTTVEEFHNDNEDILTDLNYEDNMIFNVDNCKSTVNKKYKHIYMSNSVKLAQLIRNAKITTSNNVVELLDLNLWENINNTDNDMNTKSLTCVENIFTSSIILPPSTTFLDSVGNVAINSLYTI